MVLSSPDRNIVQSLAGRTHDGWRIFRTEVGELRGLFEMESTDRSGTVDKTRVVVVHAVDISPYLNLLCVDDSSYDRGGVVAAAAFEVVDTSVVVAAYISLREKYLSILFEFYESSQTALDVLYVGALRLAACA